MLLSGVYSSVYAYTLTPDIKPPTCIPFNEFYNLNKTVTLPVKNPFPAGLFALSFFLPLFALSAFGKK